MLPAARHPVAPAPLRPRHSTCTAALRGLVREDQFRPLGAATMRRQLVAFGWALAALLVLLPARLAFAAEPSAGLVPQAVHDKAQQNGWTRVLVEVATPGRLLTAEGALSASAVAGQRAGIATAQNAALGRLAATGAAVVHRYRSVPFLALQVDAAALRELDAARAEVIRVVEDQLSLPLLYQSVPLVQGDQAWARGYEGTGATVAVLDTGVDRLHPFLAGKVVDEGCFSSGDFHFCPDGQTQALGPGTAAPCPVMAICQHGTGVAGIATGNGAGFGMPFSGVAKSASVAAYQVFSAFEAGDNLLVAALDSDILAALDHVITVHTAFNIVAVNMSLGAGRFTAPCDDDVLKPAVDTLRSYGIATIIAAGNDDYHDALARPACISTAISVSSTWKDHAAIVPIFANTAPFLTLFAPGQNILTSYATSFPKVVGSSSGTSFAAPHVAGAWAVLKQAVPGASVSDVLDALRATGVPVTDTRPGGTVTKPMIQVAPALDRLLAAAPGPRVTALTPATVTAGGPAFTLTVNGSGFASGATVLWNGVPRSTSVAGGTQATASISAADIAMPTEVRVSVRNPDGRISSAGTLTIRLAGRAAPCPMHAWYAEYFANTTFTAPATRTACEPSVETNGLYPLQAFFGDGGPAGLPSDNFSVRWTGRFVFSAGVYSFELAVNDAGRVLVDGEPVMVNDPKEPFSVGWATRMLSAGEHEITVEMYELTGWASLRMMWWGSDGWGAVLDVLTPDGVTAGGPGFTLIADGGDFVPGTQLFWNGEVRPTTYVSSSRLTASISADDIATPGAVFITVQMPDYVASNVLGFSLTAPSAGGPTLTSLSPNPVTMGGPSYTLTADGTNFVSGSVIVWNGSARTTTFVSSTRLTTVITAAEIAGWGWLPVKVRVPDGRSSNTLTYRIVQPAPTVTALTPSSAPAGSPGLTLTVDGTRFMPGEMRLLWNGAERPTSVVSDTRLTATISAADLAAAGTASVRVRAFDLQTSNALTFTITPGSGQGPTLSSLTPNTVAAGSAAFTLTADGAGFVSGATVLWNGAARTTTFVSATRLTAAIPAADVAAAGSASVTVRNPDGRASGAQTFTITSAGGGCPTGQFFAQYFANVTLGGTPARTGCETAVNYVYGTGGPAGLPVDNFSARWTGRFAFGGGSVTFTARADDGVRVFLDGAVIIDGWRDQPATTYTAARTVTAGEHEVKVEYYERLEDAVIQVSWTGAPPPPSLASLTPSTAAAGGPAFTLTADGTGFVSGATLLWNGAARTTTFVSATRVTAAIPASDIAAAGTATITVRNADGQASGAQTFTITPAGGGCPAGQFLAEYFANIGLTGAPARTACETAVNYDYGAGGPAGLPVDNFSARWTGRFTFTAGTFTFTARADDGVRLFVDGALVIDGWRDQPATTYTASRTLAAG